MIKRGLTLPESPPVANLAPPQSYTQAAGASGPSISQRPTFNSGSLVSPVRAERMEIDYSAPTTGFLQVNPQSKVSQGLTGARFGQIMAKLVSLVSDVTSKSKNVKHRRHLYQKIGEDKADGTGHKGNEHFLGLDTGTDRFVQ